MPLAATMDQLAEFQRNLVGKWHNQDFGTLNGKPVGGPENPLSYNIMPLPQRGADDEYILKNFSYYEQLNFNDTIAICAEAPNRGGYVSQNARALFYEQQVKFAEGPKKDAVVHVENGAWLWLPRFVQQPGPYPARPIDVEMVSDALQQPTNVSIAKQISVPHGNSVLALGSFDTRSGDGGEGVCRRQAVINGSPVVPDAPSPYPLPTIAVPNEPGPPSLRSNLNVEKRYTTEASTPADFQNPHPDLTQCPNKPLQQAVALIAPTSFMHWSVTTEPILGDQGIVTNIPFERSVSEVTGYWADYWMLFKGDKRYLAYTQTILMVLKILDVETQKRRDYVFPHVTCNTITRYADA